MFQSNLVAKSFMNVSRRNFGVLPKLPKVELTMRTPYKTYFNNFNGFTRVYVESLKGLMAIGNKSVPRVYLLTPGELSVVGLTEGEGNNSNSDSGKFIHTGGWLFVHENNSIEVNLMECETKEEFSFESVTTPDDNLETDSPAGRLASQLQEKAHRMIQRRR